VKSGLKFDGSRSCWRLELEAAPQNKLTRSAEPHGQREGGLRGTREERHYPHSLTASQPASKSFVASPVANRPKSEV
jgi:hypothetical protein